MSNPDNTIPEMTDPLGAHWNQPSRDEITIDDTHALMSLETFEKLPEYSFSQPSGVYNGKMWRHLAGGGEWFLCWFGDSTRPDCCSTYYRAICVVEESSI